MSVTQPENDKSQHYPDDIIIDAKLLDAGEIYQTQHYADDIILSREHERTNEPETVSQQTLPKETQLHPWEESPPKKRKKPILIGTGVMTLLAVATIAAVSALIMTGDSNHPAKCDTWLREKMVNSPEATANIENVNAVVAAIQDQRATDCSPSAWNPLVKNVSRDHESNIDVRFSTTGGISRGATVTTNTEGAPRWVYLAGENQWYSPADGRPANLGSAAHRHHTTTTTTADRDSTTSSHSEATNNSVNATNNAVPNDAERSCSRP